MYSVNLYGSHPDEENDDCWTGADFATRAEAFAAAANWRLTFAKCPGAIVSTAFIEIDGPDINQVTPNPSYKSRRAHSADRHESAMEIGMAFGCDAYNDAMGY